MKDLHTENLGFEWSPENYHLCCKSLLPWPTAGAKCSDDVNWHSCLPCLKVEVVRQCQLSSWPWGFVLGAGHQLGDKILTWTRSKSNYCLGTLPELIFEGENQIQCVDLDCLKGAVFLLNDVTDILLKLAKLVPQRSSSSKLMLLQFHYSTHQAATVS